MSDPQSKAEIRKQLAIDEDKPVDWFEALYSKSNVEGEGVPWANMGPHPAFAEWLGKHPLEGAGERALVVGCGMGDDAVALEALGFAVTAFDVSAAAIELCRERFPNSATEFLQADLLADQPQWRRRFDFVLEIYTVQALPPKYEADLIRNIADFVAPGGQLLTVAEVGDGARAYEDGPPWLLTPGHVDAFAAHGLSVETADVKAKTDDDMGAQYVTSFVRADG